MILRIIILFFLACNLIPAQELSFNLNGERGADAELADGKIIHPSSQKNVSEAGGIRGKALMINKEGALEYPPQDAISSEAGTFSIWINLNWTPSGLAYWPDRSAGKEPFRKTFHLIFSANDILTSRIDTWIYFSPVRSYSIVEQVHAEEWNHFAFTWDKNANRSETYMNGLLVQSGGYNSKENIKKLSIGSDSKEFHALDGRIDELRIYKKVLNSNEIMKLYSEFVPVSAVLMDYSGMAGRENTFRIRFVNHTDKKISRDFKFSIVSSKDGKTLKEEILTVSCEANSEARVFLKFKPEKEEDYLIKSSTNGIDHRVWEITAIAPEKITDSMVLSENGEVKMKLLDEIDCTKEYGMDRYRDDGQCSVVRSEAGSYRETSIRKGNSGFSYCFKLNKPGHPHWLEIEYPDDSDRMFFVAIWQKSPIWQRVVGSGNLDTVGVMTGGDHPLSMKMKTKKLLFWPDTDEIMVNATSYVLGDQRPAALSKIRIYENDGELPRLKIASPEKVPQRVMGIWQEDPSMEAINWFNRPENYKRSGFEFWKVKVERMVKYLRYTGKNQWSFILLEYNGDLSGALGYLLPSCDYASGNGRMPGASDLVAETFDREEIPFYIELNHRYRPGSGLFKIIGAEHYSGNMNEVLRKGKNAIEQINASNKIEGNVTGNVNSSASVNPLHPVIQAAFLKIFRAYTEKYSKFKEFQGINIISPLQLSFESGEAGYDDWTTEKFSEETGIKIAVDANSPTRFAERYQYLKKNHWDKWISWRCSKIRDFYAELLAELNKDGGRRKIIIRMSLDEKTNRVRQELAKGKAKSTLSEIYRECGVDMKMLETLGDIIIMPETAPNRSRVMPEKLDDAYYHFAPEFADVFKEEKYPASLLCMHCNMEIYWSIGKSLIKSFWWPTGGSIYDSMELSAYSTAQPNREYALENMSWLLAEGDPMMIDFGFWGCPENGAIDLFQQFYKAYLSIPALHFEKVQGINDPVTIRQHKSKDGYFFYLVNKANFSSAISFTVNTKSQELKELSTGKIWNFEAKTRRFKKELKPFEVLAFNVQSPFEILDVKQTVPADRITNIEASIADWKKKIAAYLGIYGSEPEPASVIIKEAEKFLKEKCYTQAEYRLRGRVLKNFESDLKNNIRFTLNPDASLSVELVNVYGNLTGGSIKLLKWPEEYGWSPESKELSFANLKQGERFAGKFSFKSDVFYHGAAHRFTLEIDNGKEKEIKELVISPYLALKAPPTIKIDADLSDWNGKTVWYNLSSDKNIVAEQRDKRKQPGFKDWKVKFAWMWKDDGILLAACVEDKDFMPPYAAESMWQNDSIQIYFDQMNNKSFGYDDNDLVYQVGLLNGKATVWREKCPAAQGTGAATAVEAAVKRTESATVYELFIPSTEFKRMKIEKNSMPGFSLLFNNRDKAGNDSIKADMSPSASNPYSKPNLWKDLILTEESSAKAVIFIEGNTKVIPGKTTEGHLQYPDWTKGKEQEGKVLLYNSGMQGKAWKKQSISFSPENDGKLRIALSGSWEPDENKTPVLCYRNLRISGTDTKVPSLEKWGSYSQVDTFVENGETAAKSDRKRRHFIDIDVKAGQELSIDFESRLE